MGMGMGALPPMGAMPPMGGMPPPTGALPPALPVEQCTLPDFSNAVVSHSNLGGYGPDSGPQNLRFKDVGPIPASVVAANPDKFSAGDKYDVVVTTKEGEGSKYIPSWSKREGYQTGLNKINGAMGAIVLKSDEAVDLTFSLVETVNGKDESVVLPDFYLGIFDMDSSKSAHEQVTVSGFESILVEEDAEYEELALTTKGENNADENKHVVTSKRLGYECDNPRQTSEAVLSNEVSCMSQTVTPRRRHFKMRFKNTDHFDLSFATLDRGGRRSGKGGRVFEFAGVCV